MKLSVIVPVYNTEKYLKNCILSVIRQTYPNWELLLIDDGSTDTSGSIIDAAANKDKRIRAIHKNNEGPGLTRNIGIDEATGDYVIFLDSDDYIDKDYFSLLVPKAEKNDVVFININQVNEEKKILSKEYMSDYKLLKKDRFLRNQLTGKIPWGGTESYQVRNS